MGSLPSGRGRALLPRLHRLVAKAVWTGAYDGPSVAKPAVQFACTECGYSAGRWFGKCPSCSAFGTLVEEKLAALTPSWIGSASTALSIITLLLALAAVITLALPASNAFFRRPEPEWTPPSGPAV